MENIFHVLVAYYTSYYVLTIYFPYKGSQKGSTPSWNLTLAFMFYVEISHVHNYIEPKIYVPTWILPVRDSQAIIYSWAIRQSLKQ